MLLLLSLRCHCSYLDGRSIGDDVELAERRAALAQRLVAQDQAVAVVVHVAERDHVLECGVWSGVVWCVMCSDMECGVWSVEYGVVK
jgi:hypothetical protein